MTPVPPNAIFHEPRRFSIGLPRPLWMGLATVALVLGMIGFRVGLPIYRRQVAIREIDLAGGYYQTDRSGPEWLRSRIGEDRMRSYYDPIVYVVVSQSKCDDAWMKCLEFLPDLQVVILDGSNVTDGGMQRLCGLTSLRELSIPETRVTDAGLAHLKKLSNLERVWAQNTRVTAAGMLQLDAARHLEELTIDKNSTTEAVIVDLKYRIPGLKIHMNRSYSHRKSD